MAGAAAKPRERSSSSAREIPSSSSRPIAWPKRCGPGATRSRPTPCDHLGRGLHSALLHPGNFPRLARGSRRPGHLLWRPGTAAPIPGEMPHDWLRAVAQQPANYYERGEVDHRAKDPLLKALKKRIRLQPDKVQCQEIRKALPSCLGWECFVEAWKPCDLSLTSRLKVRARSQKLLFERHEEYFPDTSMPLLYRPEDTRRQDIMDTIPGPLLLDGRPDQQDLVGLGLACQGQRP